MTWLLEMKNITKTFGAVKAVDNVSLRLNAGEVVSLCGENGSGKSTLMKVLCGIYPHGSYEGEIIFAGETLQANHIRDTERKGIAIIHQELALVKHLTVLENIFLGAEISRHGLLDYETMTLRCQKLYFGQYSHELRFRRSVAQKRQQRSLISMYPDYDNTGTAYGSPEEKSQSGLRVRLRNQNCRWSECSLLFPYQIPFSMIRSIGVFKKCGAGISFII